LIAKTSLELEVMQKCKNLRLQPPSMDQSSGIKRVLNALNEEMNLLKQSEG
jgi:hypothetical protein